MLMLTSMTNFGIQANSVDSYQTAGSTLFSTDVLKVSADDSQKMKFSCNYQPKSKKVHVL